MGRLALLSVSDKTGIVDLARCLVEEFGFSIISSGGTAQTLRDAAIPVTKVSDYTGSPEILGGRVKTLHPKIHGGILSCHDWPEHQADLAANGIDPIELVVVNLYPFEQTVARPGVTRSVAIENIDIGGPTMVRAAAKNHQYLTILCKPSQYDGYVAALRDHGGQVPFEFRRDCALAAFEHTAAYDAAIVSYLSQADATAADTTSGPWQLSGQPLQVLRYGENPHQAATWYQTGLTQTGWAAAQQLQGKALSYNNLVDLESARQIIAEFADTDQPAATILKHNNPCSVALGQTLAAAYQAAFDADSTSAFGGIVAVNRELDEATAIALTQTFLECIVAPSCSEAALKVLQTKKNLRVLVLPDLTQGPKETLKAIAGGFLVQASDDQPATPDTWQVVTELQPDPALLAELLFAWKVVRHVKSNAIVVTGRTSNVTGPGPGTEAIAHPGFATLGIGAGQMNRVGSVKIALEQAGAQAQGAVLASDGFFPFDDSVRTAAAAGIRAIVQPGGSLRDPDSIAAANELGLVMVMTGIRHFLH